MTKLPRCDGYTIARDAVNQRLGRISRQTLTVCLQVRVPTPRPREPDAYTPSLLDARTVDLLIATVYSPVPIDCQPQPETVSARYLTVTARDLRQVALARRPAAAAWIISMGRWLATAMVGCGYSLCDGNLQRLQ